MYELKDNLLQICNESGLPLEAIVFVVRDLYRDVEDAYKRYKEAVTQQEQLASENKMEEE